MSWQEVRDSQSTAFMTIFEAAKFMLKEPSSDLDRSLKVRFTQASGN